MSKGPFSMFPKAQTLEGQLVQRNAEVTESSGGRVVDANQLSTPSTLSNEIREKAMSYHKSFTSTVAAFKEVEELLGPSIVPKLVSMVAKTVLADMSGSARPAGIILKMLPNSLVSKLDVVCQYTNLSVELGLLPLTTLEKVAGSSDEALNLINKIKGIKL